MQALAAGSGRRPELPLDRRGYRSDTSCGKHFAFISRRELVAGSSDSRHIFRHTSFFDPSALHQSSSDASDEMSKKQFKSQASSGRVGAGFGAFGSGFGSAQSSPLSYIQEPLDFSGISDANVVVAFKNLSKKDSTTKAKALEDIQSHVSSDVEVEEGLLEAWVRLNRVTIVGTVDSDKCYSGQTLPPTFH